VVARGKGGFNDKAVMNVDIAYLPVDFYCCQLFGELLGGCVILGRNDPVYLVGIALADKR
jgi:hypothetical protein